MFLVKRVAVHYRRGELNEKWLLLARGNANGQNRIAARRFVGWAYSPTTASHRANKRWASTRTLHWVAGTARAAVLALLADLARVVAELIVNPAARTVTVRQSLSAVVVGEELVC